MYRIMYPELMDTIIYEFIESNGYITDTLLHALGRESKRPIESDRELVILANL